MSPFADLVRVATAQRPRRAASAPVASTRTASLLHLLDVNGPMSSAELADAACMPTRLVWGLLKAPRANGQVRYAAALWELNRDFPGADVLRAVALLTSHGWLVEPPCKTSESLPLRSRSRTWKTPCPA